MMNPVYCVTSGECWNEPCVLSDPWWVLRWTLHTVWPPCDWWDKPVYCVTPGWVLRWTLVVLCDLWQVLSNCKHEQYFDKSATCSKFQADKSSQKNSSNDEESPTTHHPAKSSRNLKILSNNSRMKMMLKVPLKVTQLLVGTVTRKYLKIILCSVWAVNCGLISNARRSKPGHTSLGVARAAKVYTGFAWHVTEQSSTWSSLYPWWESERSCTETLA